MPGFESIIGQKQPIRILATLLRKGTIPHALLFCGSDAAGKKTAALTFAMASNCLNQPGLTSRADAPPLLTGDVSFNEVNPCGDCPACRKILSGNHPDILTISPSGPIIRIAQIRSLCECVSMKPYEARRRFVIISDAQAMNPEAGNALLKLLEEPPDRTFFILLAGQISDLLPTIASRCQQIHFNPLPRKDLQTLLVEKENLPPNEAAVIADLANGDYARALFLSRPSKGTDWKRWRRWLLNASGLKQPAQLSKNPIGFRLMFAEQLSSNKEILPDALEILKVWLRDLVICKFCPEKIINTDLADTVRDVSRTESLASLIAKIETIQKAQKSIRANANARLTVEAMMMKLAC
ncbi:MAG: DNA polymerase III subunit delta' [Thermodesulfobacteriota bacterium]